MLTNNRTHFFDRHMKLRIAVQLLLDALPFLFLLILLLTMYEVLMPLYRYRLMQWIGIASLYGFTYFSIPLFLLACWMRRRAKVDFECYPGWKLHSAALRVLSFVAALLSVGWLLVVFFG